jgi:uncharacterized protein
MNKDILIGKSNRQIRLLGALGNRHGMIAGATGTGKTVSLMVMAEGFSRMGTPVFVADVKGDMSALSQAGEHKDKIIERAERIGIDDFSFDANPVELWDIWGENGLPVRAAIHNIGPALMARMLELNDTQTGVLEIAFYYANQNDMYIKTVDDMRKLMRIINDEREQVSAEYGLVGGSSIAAIQRSLLRLESDGVATFFGSPNMELSDLIRCNEDGHGIINILAAESLILKPKAYSTFLLWLLTELFNKLPEAGDMDHPKMVFFFDEAHLLFDDCPPALLQRVEQVVRLIRSKGVGIYFCSQSPDDIPETILGQLGNRVQHALRAFTPRDQKAVRAAAETFADNPDINVREIITNLGVGEALVSMLNAAGIPEPVEKAIIAPPRCRMGTITNNEREAIIEASELHDKYTVEDIDSLTDEQIRERLYYKVEQDEPVESDESESDVDNSEPYRYTMGDFFKRLFGVA